MNSENRWVKKAELIPWNKIEDRYAKLFPGKTGQPAVYQTDRSRQSQNTDCILDKTRYEPR